MEKRFGALDFLSKLQVFIGALIILGAVIFGFVTVQLSSGPEARPMSDGEMWLTAGTVVGGVLFGLSIIAAAQVFQCLMQIEINTRHTAPNTEKPETLLPPLRPLEPRAVQQLFTTTGEPG